MIYWFWTKMGTKLGIIDLLFWFEECISQFKLIERLQVIWLAIVVCDLASVWHFTIFLGFGWMHTIWFHSEIMHLFSNLIILSFSYLQEERVTLKVHEFSIWKWFSKLTMRFTFALVVFAFIWSSWITHSFMHIQLIWK